MAKKLILFVFFVLFNCNRIDYAPPAYIKEVVVYKEGSDGIMVYFILADQDGAITIANGKAILTIWEVNQKWSERRFKFYEDSICLYSDTFIVKKSNFHKTKVGMGAFQHDAIICPVGRIPYSRFQKSPSEMTGRLNLTFLILPGNSIITGKETIFF